MTDMAVCEAPVLSVVPPVEMLAAEASPAHSEDPSLLNMEPGFAVCSRHNRKRSVDYMVEQNGSYSCLDGQECKIPTAHLREPAKVFWYFCESCQIVLNSERQYSLHTKGSKHHHKVKELGALFQKRGLPFEDLPARVVPEGTDRSAVLAASDPVGEALAKPLIGKHAAKQAKASKKKKAKQLKEKERDREILNEKVAEVLDGEDEGEGVLAIPEPLDIFFEGINTVDDEEEITTLNIQKYGTCPPAIYGTYAGAETSNSTFGDLHREFGAKEVWSGQNPGLAGHDDSGPLSSSSVRTLTGSLPSEEGVMGVRPGTAPHLALFAKGESALSLFSRTDPLYSGVHSAPTLRAVDADSEKAWASASVLEAVDQSKSALSLSLSNEGNPESRELAQSSSKLGNGLHQFSWMTHSLSWS